MMDTLPTLTLTLRETNPEYVPIYADGDVKPINYDEYQKDYEIEVEVVQLNLNSGGMRVRYEWPDKYAKRGVSVQSRDVSISHFFKQYEIKEVA
jgi:hypothetical protein